MCSWSASNSCSTCYTHRATLTTRTSSDMEIKNFISGMNPGMRNLKRIHQCGALNKPSLQGKWYRSVSAFNSHNIISGLSEDALDQSPSDSEILRFSDQFDPTMMYYLVLHLGITDQEWKDMEYNHPGNIAVVRFLIMTKWREAKSGKFRDVFAALEKMKVDEHQLCQVGTGSLNSLVIMKENGRQAYMIVM